MAAHEYVSIRNEDIDWILERVGEKEGLQGYELVTITQGPVPAVKGGPLTNGYTAILRRSR